MTKLRTPDQIVDDMLFPFAGGAGDLDLCDRRYQAIAEVLCRLPENVYAKLLEQADKFVWFVPHEDVRGQVYPFTVTHTPRGEKNALKLAPYSRVVYLSPRMEKNGWDVCVAIVAHELAHVILDHPMFSEPAKYDAIEQQVFDSIVAWGFEKEAKAHRALHKRREAREERELQRLRDEM